MVPTRRIIAEAYDPGQRAIGFGIGYEPEEGPAIHIGFWFWTVSIFWRPRP